MARSTEWSRRRTLNQPPAAYRDRRHARVSRTTEPRLEPVAPVADRRPDRHTGHSERFEGVVLHDDPIGSRRDAVEDELPALVARRRTIAGSEHDEGPGERRLVETS